MPSYKKQSKKQQAILQVTKKCTRCNINKLLSDFHAGRKRSHCKVCIREAQRGRYHNAAKIKKWLNDTLDAPNMHEHRDYVKKYFKKNNIVMWNEKKEFVESYLKDIKARNKAQTQSNVQMIPMKDYLFEKQLWMEREKVYQNIIKNITSIK